MGDQSEASSNEALVGTLQSIRKLVSNWIWRIEASAIWVWLLGFFTSPGSFPANLHQLRFLISGAGLIGGQVLFLAIKPDRKNGCLTVILGFPLYVASWPIWALLLLLGGSSSILTGSYKQTQRFLGSVLPYGFTLLTYIGLTYLPPKSWYEALIVVAVGNLCLVLLSLIVWVFQPLPLIRNFLVWAMKRNLVNATIAKLPQDEQLAQPEPKARQDFTAGVKSIVSARLNGDKLPSTPLFEDQVIVAAFARKFAVSLLHTALIFGLIHYALNNMPPSIGSGYSDLPLGALSAHWFDYAYYAFMTLVSGNVSVDALTHSTKLAVAGNALTGVLFLIILITTYSMVTRERAKKTMDELLAQSKTCAGEMERMLLNALVRANSADILNDELVPEFAKVAEFKGLDPTESKAYSGILALAKASLQLERERRIDDIALVQKVRALKADPVRHFARFGEALAGADDADSVLLVIRRMP